MMHNIAITMEKTIRVTCDYEVSDEVYNEIVNTNFIPKDYVDDMRRLIEESPDDTVLDYCVKDDDKDTFIVDW